MPRLPDTADYYTQDRALDEEVNWILGKHWEKHLAFLQPRLEGVKSIIEMGCGSGLLAAALPEDVAYTGVDKNEFFLRKARLRNKDSRSFKEADVRLWCAGVGERQYDLAMAWNFLKNFALDEWASVVDAILCWGKHGAFNVQFAPMDLDDGEAFPHVYVTRQRLEQAVNAAGHVIESEAVLGEWKHAGEIVVQDLALWTRRLAANEQPPTPARKTVRRLEIDGHAAETGSFALRWKDGGKPELYREGRRVVKPWRMVMDVEVEGDPHGGNANTD